MPIGMVIQKLGYSLLGLQDFRDYVHWIYVVVGITVFVSITVAIMSLFHRIALREALHISLFPLGVLWIMSPAMFFVASGTVAALYHFSFIPDFRLDYANFDNFDQIWVIEYGKCAARANALLEAMYIPMNELMPPIRYLPVSLVPVTVFYMGVYSYLLGYLLRKSQWTSAVGVVIAAIIYYSMLGGLGIWMAYSMGGDGACETIATDLTNERTANDQLNRFARQVLLPNVGKYHDGGMLKGIRVEDKSVVIEFAADDTPLQVFLANAETTRENFKAVYCKSDGADHLFKTLGASLVHVYRRADGTHLHTLAINRDECRT